MFILGAILERTIHYFVRNFRVFFGFAQKTTTLYCAHYLYMYVYKGTKASLTSPGINHSKLQIEIVPKLLVKLIDSMWSTFVHNLSHVLDKLPLFLATHVP